MNATDVILAVLAPKALLRGERAGTIRPADRSIDLAKLLTGDNPSWAMRDLDSILDHGATEKQQDSGANNEWFYVIERAFREGVTANTIDLLYSNLLKAIEDRCEAAEIAAIAMCTAVLAGEQTNYGMSMKVLAEGVRYCGGNSQIEMLCRASLLQQQTLRDFDRGYHANNRSHEAASIALSINIDALVMEFVGGGPEGRLPQLVRQVVGELFHSAQSLIPTFSAEASLSAVKERMQESDLAQEVPSVDANFYASVQSQYARWMHDEFEKRLRSKSVTWGRAQPDLYFENMLLELRGHRAVYDMRKQLALMRLLSSISAMSRADVAGCVRLLRQAGSLAELDLLIAQIMDGGPLHALVDDARDIVQNSSEQFRWRDSEMKVLAAASEFMSQQEAFDVCTTVLDSIEKNNLPEMPFTVRIGARRFEEALNTSVALGNSSGSLDRVLKVLIRIQSDTRSDPHWDRVVARALRRVRRDGVSANIRSMIADSIEDEDPRKSDYAATAHDFLRLARSDSGRNANSLEDLAAHFNNHIANGTPLSLDFYSAAVKQTVDGLIRIQSDARREVYSGGGVMPAEFAAFLIRRGRLELWRPLMSFLCDVAVARVDKTSAFDLLWSDSTLTVPEAVVNEFRDPVARIVVSNGVHLMDKDSELVPYPAALRFGGVVCGFSESWVRDQFIRLLARSDSESLEESAICASALSRVTEREWLIVAVLQLSHSRDPRVRARSIMALNLQRLKGSNYASACEDRLLSLLGEDGTSLPLAALKSLSSGTLSPRLTQRLHEMQALHPARSVREKASELLRL